MKAMHWLAAAVAIAGATTTGASELTLYEHDNFGGRRWHLTETATDLGGTSFNDRASSAVIRGGTWQLCTDAYFRGRCVNLQPGDYPSLGAMGLNDRVSSARDVGRPGGGPRAAVSLYEGHGFAGAEFQVSGPVANLDGRFNDRAQSMIVHGGTWEVCGDAGFRGGCQVYGPGRYSSLGPLAGRVSSLRPAGGPGGGGPGGGPDNWGSGRRAVLYEGPNLSGRHHVAGDYMPNLDGTGFNDRVSSLRIERGYWVFCSDAHFRGECRTFGPGDHLVLPPELNNRISSGRRISDDFPYNSKPNWQYPR